ncbi:hypothetical protein AUR64_13995 [Haloprofundus marisrubri]|uniref:Uncharacterized protein n=1 Tax=Haloprofundus marisrubri TaxID=1514971 RepID=A0A0W1R600_9EURY|nr:hypothetical protein [Haloprofundus marisrubri]KTG08918.1 hypothetical protein AUR64_13995 [Haloprofundus marisrubri]
MPSTHTDRIVDRCRDPRVWLLTLVILGLYVLGTSVNDATPFGMLAAPAFLFMFAYMMTLGTVLLTLSPETFVTFFGGFVVFTFLTSALLVSGYDRLARRVRKSPATDVQA